MLRLENDNLRVDINPLGAELIRLYNKLFRLEYLWQAGKEWSKSSPVLFPIVGQLKDNIYTYNGNEYTLPRHGFAREKLFNLIEEGTGKLVFRLKDDEDTRKNYPFQFHFDISYTLKGNELNVEYHVFNTGKDTMYFSVGAHPAFRVPLDLRDHYDDYYIEFSDEEDSSLWPLKEGLISDVPASFFTSKRIPLSKALFESDALVFKNIRSEYIHLRSNQHDHGLSVKVNQCPFLGLWAAKGANFLCIEPWQGIADSVHSTGKIEEKEGIIPLKAGENFSYVWSVRVM